MVVEEIWKPITNILGYEVSNLGRIKSLDKIIITKHNRSVFKKERILKPHLNSNGYERTFIGGQRLFVHRLVAQAFIPNPNNYNCVNHKDFNPLNNCVDNLEWCTHKQNMEYSKKAGRMKWGEERRQKILKAQKLKPVKSVNLTTGEIRRFKSIHEAAKVYGSAGDICDSCRVENHTYKGCKFYYDD